MLVSQPFVLLWPGQLNNGFFNVAIKIWQRSFGRVVVVVVRALIISESHRHRTAAITADTTARRCPNEERPKLIYGSPLVLGSWPGIYITSPISFESGRDREMSPRNYDKNISS